MDAAPLSALVCSSCCLLAIVLSCLLGLIGLLLRRSRAKRWHKRSLGRDHREEGAIDVIEGEYRELGHDGDDGN